MILEFRLEHESAELVPIAEQLASLCDYFITYYERFDLTPNIYGDVRSRFEALQRKFLTLTDGAIKERKPI